MKIKVYYNRLKNLKLRLKSLNNKFKTKVSCQVQMAYNLILVSKAKSQLRFQT